MRECTVTKKAVLSDCLFFFSRHDAYAKKSHPGGGFCSRTNERSDWLIPILSIHACKTPFFWMW